MFISQPISSSISAVVMTWKVSPHTQRYGLLLEWNIPVNSVVLELIWSILENSVVPEATSYICTVWVSGERVPIVFPSNDHTRLSPPETIPDFHSLLDYCGKELTTW